MTYTLFSNEIRRLFVTPLAWIVLAIGQLIVAWAFFSELEAYENIQSRLIASESSLGITSLVGIPALLNGLNIIMLMTPLLTMRAIAGERQNQRFELLLASSATALQILTAKLLSVLAVLTIFWLLVLLQILTLNLATSLDLGKIMLTWFTGILVIVTYSSAGIWLSSITQHPIIAAISTYGVIILLRLSGQADESTLLNWYSVTQHIQSARLGIFNSSDLVYFLLIISLFIGLAWNALLRFRNAIPLWSPRVTLVLLITCLTLSWPALNKHQYTVDMSHNRQNTVSPATQELLQRLTQPLSFTVYVSNNPILKKQIQQLISRFKRSLPSLVIRFVDPQQHPEAARVLGLTRNGEILVRYNDRQQLVKKLDETEISKTIMHLDQRRHGWIVNLQGHDEMSLLDEGLFGANMLAKNLQARGYQIRDFNLNQHNQLPDNTELIIIAAARAKFTQLESLALNTFIENGGNLLWLTEPDINFKQQSISALPPIDILPGVIVDATAAKLKLASPDNAIVSQYNTHQLTSNLTQYTLFPQAAALEVTEDDSWEIQTRLTTGSLSWNETGSLKGNIDRDPVLFEQQGPLTVGALLQRSVANRNQKVAFLGDSDFIRNHMLGQGDNLQLTLNLFYWLTDNSNIQHQTVSKPTDQALNLTKTQQAAFGLFFMLLLPIFLATTGFFIPWKRKRRS